VISPLLEGKYRGLFIKRTALLSASPEIIQRIYISLNEARKSESFFICLGKQYGGLNCVSRAAPWVRERPVTLEEYNIKILLV
jgi:hypothetical protein